MYSSNHMCLSLHIYTYIQIFISKYIHTQATKITNIQCLIILLYFYFNSTHRSLRAPQVALVVKNLPAAARDARDMGSIPGLGRSSGGGNGNPLQYSCLGNPMDKGAWWAAVCKGRKESDTTEATEHRHTYVIKYFSTAWFLMAVEYFFLFFPFIFTF